MFGDGKQTRDYIYVGDVVAAALAAASSETSGPVNIGTGIETDVLELAARLGELGGREDFEPEFAPPRPARWSGSRSTRPRRARAGLAAVTDLADGLRLTLDSL